MTVVVSTVLGVFRDFGKHIKLGDVQWPIDRGRHRWVVYL